MRPKMIKLAKRKILPIKISPSQQQPQQMENNNNNNSDMRSSQPNTTTHFAQNPQLPPYEGPNDIPGLVAWSKKLNQECMKMMADMTATNNDFDKRLGKIEKTYQEIIHDLSVRLKVLEIMYQNQGKEIDVIKNILKMQLQCTNNLTYRLLSMNQYNQQQQVNGVESVALISPQETIPQEIQSQSPFMFNEVNSPSTSEFVRSNTESDENALSNQEQNTVNQGVRRCEFCGKTFATERYLCLHQMRIPKYCSRKRTRLLSQHERQENAKRSRAS